jgi:hypothetical protein
LQEKKKRVGKKEEEKNKKECGFGHSRELEVRIGVVDDIKMSERRERNGRPDGVSGFGVPNKCTGKQRSYCVQR